MVKSFVRKKVSFYQLLKAEIDRVRLRRFDSRVQSIKSGSGRSGVASAGSRRWDFFSYFKQGLDKSVQLADREALQSLHGSFLYKHAKPPLRDLLPGRQIGMFLLASCKV